MQFNGLFCNDVKQRRFQNITFTHLTEVILTVPVAPGKNLRSLGKYAPFFDELGINIFLLGITIYHCFVSLCISKLSVGYPCKLISLRQNVGHHVACHACLLSLSNLSKTRSAAISFYSRKSVGSKNH